MDIETVVQRAAAGDEQAWRQLMSQYDRLLRSVASGLRMRRCDADDATQQTWLSLRESIHTLRQPDRVQAWLRRVMHRKCIRILRRQQAERLDADPGRWPVLAPVVDAVAAAETAAALWATLNRLPDRERRLLRALFDGAERSYREIAEQLAMPIGAIGPVRRRALNRLPAMLAEAGVTVADLHAVA
jgi:RNA polymerase sigma factor (sigma-70 family)